MSNSNAAGFTHFWMIEIDKCSVGWGKSGQVDRYLSRWLQLCWNLLAEGTAHTCIEFSVLSLRNTKIFMLQEHDTEEHKDRIRVYPCISLHCDECQHNLCNTRSCIILLWTNIIRVSPGLMQVYLPHLPPLINYCRLWLRIFCQLSQNLWIRWWLLRLCLVILSLTSANTWTLMMIKWVIINHTASIKF